MGGVTIDAEARVLNEKGEPIKGLYAAGELLVVCLLYTSRCV